MADNIITKTSMCPILTDDFTPITESEHDKSASPLDKIRSGKTKKEPKASVSGAQNEPGSYSPQSLSNSSRIKGLRYSALSATHLPSNAKQSNTSSPNSFKEAAKTLRSVLDDELAKPFLPTCSGRGPREKFVVLPGIGKSSSSSVSDCSTPSVEDIASGGNVSSNAKPRTGSNANNNSILKTNRASSSDSMSSTGYERKGKAGKARRKSKSKKESLEVPIEGSETELYARDSNLLDAVLEDVGEGGSSDDLVEELADDLRRDSSKYSEKGLRRKSRKGSIRKGSIKGSRRNSTKDSPRPSRRNSRKDSPRGSRKNSMRLFKKYKKGLKRVAESEMSAIEKVKDTAKEARRRIAYVYNILDHERAGKLTMRYVRIGVLALGFVPGEKGMNWLEDKMIELQSNTEEANLITLETFMSVMTVALRDHLFQPSSYKELQMAFRTLDTANNGFLTEDELREALTREGEPLTENELAALIDEGIPEDRTVLNYNDYAALMLRTQELLPY